MKKLVIIQAAFLLTSLLFLNTAKGQTSIGLTFGTFIPTQAASAVDAHYGFNLSGKYNINPKIRVGANFGYYFKNVNDQFGIWYSTFITPITGLFEYSFTENDFSPYVGADLGLYRIGASLGGLTIAFNGFGAAPVAGFNYNLSERFAINTHAKYHFIMIEGETIQALSINAGLAVKF